MALERTALPPVAAIRRRLPGTLQRSAASPPRTPARTLQERIGNQATQAYIARAAKSTPAQAGATPGKVSKKNDTAELEAEEAAKKVLRLRETAAKPPAVAKTTVKDTVQRAEAAPSAPARPSNVHIAGGAPLPKAVRSFMEPRFGANFSNVRVHTGESAAKQSASLNAHAFTVGQHILFGRDQFQPQSDGGRQLIAHELAHTIQQGSAPEPRVHRFGISDALNWIADKANLIPGFRLLTIVLGMNPINWAPVARNGVNLIRALLEMIPITGPLIEQALDKYGIIDKVGAWVDGQIHTLGLVGSNLKKALDKFLDSLSWTDIFDLDGVYERGKRIFTEPIDQLIAFGKNLVSDILEFIRKAVLLPLAALAENTKGYDLLKAVLKQDPITGEPVPRNAETVIGGFMKLIGQEEIWENAKKANAGQRLWAWFENALNGLLGFVSRIPTLFINTLKSLEITDLLFPPKAFLKFATVFGGFALEFISWAGNAMWTLLEIIFDVVSPDALKYIKKTGAALKSILQNPLPFMGNLIKAAKLGFDNFADHFLEHLKTGLIEWLTGALPGIYIPKAFSLVEIAKFAFSVLGLSWANIRQKLVKATNETTVKALETGFDIVVTLVRDGPAAAWDKIKEQLANLKDMVIDGIIDMIVGLVVKKAIPKLVAMFIPGAGFISAILSIYETIMVFVKRIAKIIQVVKSFVDSIVSIANGAIDAAATRVENTLAGLLSLAINFLAGFAGLGNVADKVMGVIEKIRAPIDKALDWLVGWIVNAAKSIGKFAKETAAAVVDWWKEKFGFTNKAGESHTLQFIGSGDSAKLGVSSELMTVRQYLDSHPDKGKPDWNAADAALKSVEQVIYSPARKTEDEKKRRATIRDALAKVSAALAELGGEPPKPEDYGKSATPTYGNPAAVEVIVDKPLSGTETGPWPLEKPGYKEIHERGLTKVPDKWVQMHIISARLGGSGTNFENLIPAPNSVNTGPFLQFEKGAATLASGKSGNIKNRVWVEVAITGAKNAATAIVGRAGLYFWKGKPKGKPEWVKDDKPSLSVNAGVPVPQLGPGPAKLVLNFTGSTDMQRDFEISSKIATLIKEGRPYASVDAFVKSMTDRGAAPADVAAVLAKGPVLNGP
jgi:uncharacterized protein DUF4157